MNETALTIRTHTSPELPARRSIDYRVWLTVELAKLAAYLGQQGALDKDGYRASEMAKDLDDTIPEAMNATLRRLRREISFFPTTKEILAAYAVCIQAKRERDRQAAQQAEQAMLDELERLGAAGSKKVVNVNQLIQEALRKQEKRRASRA